MPHNFVETSGFIIIRDLIYSNDIIPRSLPHYFLKLILPDDHKNLRLDELDYVIDLNNICVFIKIYNYPYFYSENPIIVLKFCRLINHNLKIIESIKNGYFDEAFQRNSQNQLQKYVITEYGKGRISKIWLYFTDRVEIHPFT